MKIVNATVYSTKDLLALWVAVTSICAAERRMSIADAKARLIAQGETWKETDYWLREQREVKTLRIGYYNAPKTEVSDEKVDADICVLTSFTSLRGRSSPSPRIGIVKPDRLPLNPLVVLAHCADSANRALPEEVVLSIAEEMARTMLGDITNDEMAEVLEHTQIRFSLKVKSKAKQAAKAADRAATVAQLEDKIWYLTNDIAKHDARMHKAEAKRDKLQDRLAKLEGRMSLNV